MLADLEIYEKALSRLERMSHEEAHASVVETTFLLKLMRYHGEDEFYVDNDVQLLRPELKLKGYIKFNITTTKVIPLLALADTSTHFNNRHLIYA
jgi:hypothetical protein